MDHRQHTSQIRYLHSQLARDVPIGAFVELMEPEAVGLTDKTQFYAPVRFSVQVCGGINAAAGAVRVDVPVHGNPDWLQDMKERFAGMMGISASHIEFKTVDGKSLDEFPVDFLDMAGKLHVYADGKEMRLAKMPEIPLEYRVNKESNVDAWYQKVAQELPERLAGALVGKDINQVNAAIRGEGPVQEIIAAEMRKAASPFEWAEFARTHNINSPHTLEAEEGRQILNAASKEALLHVRKFIEVSAKQIGHYIAGEQNSKTPHLDVNLCAPVLVSSREPRTNGFEMYRKLMEDAFATPVVQQAVVERVYNMPLGCRYRDGKRPRPGKDGGKGKEKVVADIFETELEKYSENVKGSTYIAGEVESLNAETEVTNYLYDTKKFLSDYLKKFRKVKQLEKDDENTFNNLLGKYEEKFKIFTTNNLLVAKIKELEGLSQGKIMRITSDKLTKVLEDYKKSSIFQTNVENTVNNEVKQLDEKFDSLWKGEFSDVETESDEESEKDDGKGKSGDEEEFVSADDDGDDKGKERDVSSGTGDEGNGSTSEGEKDIPAAPKKKKQNSPEFFKQFEDKYLETVKGKQKPAGYKKDVELETAVRTFLEKGLDEMPSKKAARKELNALLENLKKARKFYEQNFRAIMFIQQKSKEKLQFSETEFSKLIEQEKSKFDAEANAAVKQMVNTYTTDFENQYKPRSSDEESVGSPPPRSSDSRDQKILKWLGNAEPKLVYPELYAGFIKAMLNAKNNKIAQTEAIFNQLVPAKLGGNLFGTYAVDKLKGRWSKFQSLFFDATLNAKKLNSDLENLSSAAKAQDYRNLIGPFLQKNAALLGQSIREKMQAVGINSQIGASALIGGRSAVLSGSRKAHNERKLLKVFPSKYGPGGPNQDLLADFLSDYLQNANKPVDEKRRIVEKAFSGTDENKSAFGGSFTYSIREKGRHPRWTSSGLSRWLDFKMIFNIDREMFPDDNESGDDAVDWERRKEYLLSHLNVFEEKLKEAGLRLATIDAHHPWNALIHHTLQPAEADGAYPAYYNLLHTKQDMSADASFDGDVESTYAAHHLFSGAAPLPPAMKIAGVPPKMELIGWGETGFERNWMDRIFWALEKLERKKTPTTRVNIWNTMAKRNRKAGVHPPMAGVFNVVVGQLVEDKILIEKEDGTLHRNNPDLVLDDDIPAMQMQMSPVHQDDTLSLLQEKMRSRLVPIKAAAAGLPKLIPISAPSNYGLPSIYDDDGVF